MARRTPAEHLHLALFGDSDSLRTEFDVAVAFQSVPQHRVAVLKHHFAFPVVGLKGVGGVSDELYSPLGVSHTSLYKKIKIRGLFI